MKRLLLLSLAALLGSGAHAQQLPNTGFENWRTTSYGEVPAGNANYTWTSVDTIPQLFGGTVVRPSVLKVGAAHSGNYALCLQAGRASNPFVNDTILSGGYLFLGEFDPASSGLGGVPYTNRPFGVTGYYKMTVSVPDVDTATVAVQFTRGGNFVGSAIRDFSPSQSWQPFDIPVNWISNDAPDQMDVLLGMGLFDLEIEDSTARFYLDDVSLSLPNGLKQSLFATDDMKVFPNPAQGRVQVQLAGSLLQKGSYLTVHNAAGQQVARRDAQPSNEFSLESQPGGTYFIQLRDASGTVLYGSRLTLR